MQDNLFFWATYNHMKLLSRHLYNWLIKFDNILVSDLNSKQMRLASGLVFKPSYTRSTQVVDFNDFNFDQADVEVRDISIFIHLK